MMTTKDRTTVSLEREDHERLRKVAEQNGWPVGKAATLAFGALETLMDAHQAFATQLEDDIGELYMRLAAEAPAGFVDVPKDGIRCGYAGDLPAIMVDNWLVFPDRETGVLLAEEQGGEGRIARVVDGEIKPLKFPSPEEVALN
jgi:hypothetical protein